MSKYKYYKSIFKGQRMPLAYVDLDLMHQNIDVLIERAKGKNIRIASKSIRCKSVMERILQSNNQFKGIMCFTAEEAVYLAENRFDDIILAYPIVHPPHIQAIAQKVKSGAKIYMMVDRMEHIHIIEEALKDADIKIPICIDIDMSVDFPGLHFGVWRSSLRSMKDFTKFVDKVLLSEKVVEAYCAGANAYFVTHWDELLIKKAFPLQPVDVISGYMLGMSLMAGIDGALKSIVEEKMAEYIPDQPDYPIIGSNAIAFNANI